MISTTTLLVALTGVAIAAPQTPRFGERVNVRRIIVDARVLDDRGNPVIGLSADDFKVRVDGKPGRVETATWVGDRPSELDEAPIPSAPVSAGGRALGRLVVFLFQKDLEPGRIEGLMQMLLRSRNFLDTLTDVDRVAILSFDSHLKIWTDFTNNRDRLAYRHLHGLHFGAHLAHFLQGPFDE